MALTPSIMLPLGTKAPSFTLLDVVSGRLFDLHTNHASVATVIMFICNHCPYVKHIQDKLTEVAQMYSAHGIQFIAINSNDPINYPDDAPDQMRAIAIEKGYPFPYLFDETQAVAKAYQAACTPDFYVFDKNLLCVYRGQFDASRPRNDVPVTGADLTAALDCVLANKAVDSNQQPSIGCNIKWK